MQLILFGIQQMDRRFHVMKPENLLLKRNELILFFGIAGDCKADDRKLKAPLGLNGRGNNGIVSEDLLGLIGIGSFTPDTDSGCSVIGQPGTPEIECIGRLAYQG